MLIQTLILGRQCVRNVHSGSNISVSPCASNMCVPSWTSALACAVFRILEGAPRRIKAQREGALLTRRLGQHHVSQTSKLDTLRCKEQ